MAGGVAGRAFKIVSLGDKDNKSGIDLGIIKIDVSGG